MMPGLDVGGQRENQEEGRSRAVGEEPQSSVCPSKAWQPGDCCVARTEVSPGLASKRVGVGGGRARGQSPEGELSASLQPHAPLEQGTESSKGVVTTGRYGRNKILPAASARAPPLPPHRLLGPPLAVRGSRIREPQSCVHVCPHSVTCLLCSPVARAPGQTGRPCSPRNQPCVVAGVRPPCAGWRFFRPRVRRPGQLPSSLSLPLSRKIRGGHSGLSEPKRIPVWTVCL